MDQGVEAAAVDRNFVAAFRELSAGVEGGTVRTIGRVHVSATRFPIAFFNAAFVTEPLAPGAADVAEAVSMLRDLGVPFVAHVRADLGAEAIAAVAGLGLVAGEALPGMSLRPGRCPTLQPRSPSAWPQTRRGSANTGRLSRSGSVSRCS
jgi:hypothetical protein